MLNQLPKPTIEKGIPIPAIGGFRRTGPGARRSSPLWEMEVSDSAFFPGRTAATMASFGRAITKRSGGERKFASRTVTENGVKGVRVWRIA